MLAPVLLCAALLCGACSNMVSSRPPPEPAEQPQPQEQAPAPAPEPRGELTRAELAEIRYLLDEADRAIREDHLTYPSKGSALILYEEVMAMDPDNEAARRGLERIVERYLELALHGAEARRFDQADAMLDRARLVDPEHPGIDPVATRVQLLRTAERRVIELNAEQLRDRHPAVEEALRQAGLASQANGCRAHITARNDSEGRWIYQQMSEAGKRARIQAQLDIGSRPRIEVLCFSEGE